MNDAPPCLTGPSDFVPDVVKQPTYSAFLQNRSRRSSVSSRSDSGSSDGSSVASPDSQITDATSISPDFTDQYVPSSISDILLEDDIRESSYERVSTADLASSAARGHGPWLKRRLSDEIGPRQTVRAHVARDTDHGGAHGLHGDYQQPRWSARGGFEHGLPEPDPRTGLPGAARISDWSPQCQSQPDVVQSRPQAQGRIADVPSSPRSHRAPPLSEGGPCSIDWDRQTVRQNPRRTKPEQPRIIPQLQRQEDRRHSYVDCLVDTTMKIVAHIWPSSVRPVHVGADHRRQEQSATKSVICFRFFIEEVLKRSRASHSTLQVALFYCYKLHRSGRIAASQGGRQSEPARRSLQCGRRMFLCSLILASKFIQDKNYSTRAWSKISSLPICEINQCEAAMLRALDYEIFIRAEVFAGWSKQITMCVERSRRWMNPQFTHLDMTVDSDRCQVPTATFGPPPEVLYSRTDPALSGSPSATVERGEPFDLSIRAARDGPQPPRAAPSRDVTSAAGAVGSIRDWERDAPEDLVVPRAPQLSNVSSPTSSPDSDSGHPSTMAGCLLHRDTGHPTAGGSAGQRGADAPLETGLPTPASSSSPELAPGSMRSTTVAQGPPLDVADTVANGIGRRAPTLATSTGPSASAREAALTLSPSAMAADARAWRELETARSQPERDHDDLSEVTPTPESAAGHDDHLQEQEDYLAENPWIESLEDDMGRRVDRQRSHRKAKPASTEYLQRKRSIGRCAGHHGKAHTARREKIPCHHR